MIKARIICDSITEGQARLTTFLVTYHRFVHAEHLRHRMQSFNVSSSRAIPGSKMAELVRAAKLEPVFWGKNQKGMQSREELSDSFKDAARALWTDAREAMLGVHDRLLNLGLHKQIANRLLEPWLPVTVLCSATDWANFFMLRSHPDAQQEIQALSDAMLYQYVNHTPTFLERGEWHIPFGDKMDMTWDLEMKRKVATARCARLSYLTFDGNVDPVADVRLHNDLAAARHWSPFEHIAEARDDGIYHGNFYSWRQYRKLFIEERWHDGQVDLKKLLAERQAAGSPWALGRM